LPILRSLNAIDAIVTDGWITMSDGFYRPSQMYVSTSKRDFSDLVSKEDEKSRILRFLLRRYEGLFIEFVKIDEQVVAKNLKLTKAKVVSYLQHLHKEQIIKYEPRKTIPLITFLQSRPQIDSFTINVKLYNQLKERSSKRLSAIIDYLSQDRCRQRFILEYFGEKKIDNCGTCDLCRGSNITEIDKMTQELLDNHLLQSLATSPRIKLYDYLRYWPHNKRKRILTYLQESMHEIGVKLDQNYLVKEKQ
ncbi:RecQ family zinc-binding domain-containing protein, partial [bacterium]|nr:RecQ family zinc-binding domain-containing protein [bacterium]